MALRVSTFAAILAGGSSLPWVPMPLPWLPMPLLGKPPQQQPQQQVFPFVLRLTHSEVGRKKLHSSSGIEKVEREQSPEDDIGTEKGDTPPIGGTLIGPETTTNPGEEDSNTPDDGPEGQQDGEKESDNAESADDGADDSMGGDDLERAAPGDKNKLVTKYLKYEKLASDVFLDKEFIVIGPVKPNLGSPPRSTRFVLTVSLAGHLTKMEVLVSLATGYGGLLQPFVTVLEDGGSAVALRAPDGSSDDGKKSRQSWLLSAGYALTAELEVAEMLDEKRVKGAVVTVSIAPEAPVVASGLALEAVGTGRPSTSTQGSPEEQRLEPPQNLHAEVEQPL